MARTRLTTFSKLLLVLLAVTLLFFAFQYFRTGSFNIFDNNNSNNNNNNDSNNTETNDSRWNTNKKKDDNTIRIGVVTWGGYAAGQYFNEGFQANTNSRFYKDYGFKVEFEILDDFVASRKAFENDQVNLLWATIDAFPTEAAQLRGEPQIVFQADWSRGGDAVVVRRGINRVSDLKGKKIAVAELTPSHTFLLWLLKAGDLTEKDVELEIFSNAIDAAQAFKSRQVDAAVVWSPDDEACIDAVPGSRVLENTKSASHIIADVFMAKKDWIRDNKTKLEQLYEGWMKGAAELNDSNPGKREVARKKAAKILANNFEGFSEADTYAAIENVRLCTHGDNMNFFGLNSDYKNVTGEKLYTEMANEYRKLGYIKENPPSWRLIAESGVVRSAKLGGGAHAEEAQKKFIKVTKDEGKKKDAIATKRLSIVFASGSSKLDENAKNIIDIGFVDIAKAFSNSMIRIEGNTDNVGNKGSNINLSVKRANAVADYLEKTHGMPRDRFILIGNGPDKPVPGCESNQNEACRSKNRRTDFELVK